ncbi:MAG: EAL domain-containing protein [Bacilli bacterium]|jgi:EAL domain-containing protein (putative c-di-GMP-specific phosphodiesterase class I)|nr:EAL domain-containing protein [Bacilli bacterium]NLN80445.1 EAL domain-containing protein [Erysipelotrichia bacterium]
MKNKNPNYPLRYSLYFLGFIIFFIVNIIVSAGLFDSFIVIDGNLAYKILAIVILTLTSIAFLVFALINYSRSQQVSVKRVLNTNLFPLAENILDERDLILQINKFFRRKEYEEAVAIAFSTFKFKKEVFLRYGYEKESKVISMVFLAIDELKKQYPKLLYGYDYSDNFLLFIPKYNEKKMQQSLEKLSEHINHLLSEEKVNIDFNPHYGLSIRNKETSSAESLFQTALIASDFGRLNTDRGGIFIFNDSMFKKSERNVGLARDIEEGLKKKEFEVFFQPKYDLKLKRFVSSEALLRWIHPERGVISPAAFISLAEQSDLIIEIDKYVFDLVCQRLAHWRDHGKRLLPISVNLSKRMIFSSDVVPYIEETIKKYKINPMLLEVEIVESPSPYDVLYLLAVVKKIKALNIKVAIDDFGTGFSSLSYIKRIPFDIIKIDRAFLSDLEIDEKSRGLVREIIKIAHILEAYVVIEGVQEYEQIRLLQSMGANCIQGFYYSEPLRPENYMNFLENNRFEKGRGGN